MTDSVSKSKRRRWRRLLAGFVLFLVIFLSWWYWPRGDVRFIGKWQTSTNGFPSAVTFHANGMAVTEVQGLRFTYPWRIAGDRLIYGWNLSGLALPPARGLAELWQIVTGRTPVIGEESMDLTEIADDVIRFRRPDVPDITGDEAITWSRVVE